MQDIGQLPEFDVLRLLETAHQQLRGADGAAHDAEAIQKALDVVNGVLQARHQSSTENASEHAEQLRRAAHALVPIADEPVQRAMQAMLAAAHMCR